MLFNYFINYFFIMKANETILSTFFENKSFKIPDYQRGYDWKNSNFDM